ncbi:MAG: tetratricopeptide repeat protein [Candidatus Omnitrophota bacterium]
MSKKNIKNAQGSKRLYPHKTTMRSALNKFHLLALLLIATAGFLIYANSLRGGFLWDDRFLVEENLLIRELGRLPEIFMRPLTPHFNTFYRPLANVSFMVDYYFWKLNPFGYHLANIALHIFSALLVYGVVYVLSRERKIALGCGLIFSVHTVLSEPVNYISSRADLLLALFFLLSFFCYIKYRGSEAERKTYYICSLLSFICSLLSKEMAVILPLILLIYELTLASKRETFKRIWFLLLPFLIIVVVYGLLRISLLKFPHAGLYVPKNTIADIPFIKRFPTALSAIPIYVRLFILPIGLHKGWLIKPVRSIFEMRVVIGVLFIIALFMFATYMYRRSKIVTFSILWFFVLLLPVLNIFPLNAFLSEGWFYLPSIGCMLCISSLVVRFASSKKLSRNILIIFLVMAVTCYSLLTVRRNNVWAGDAGEFYKDILRYNPYEDRIHNLLGNVYLGKEKFDEALGEYAKSLALNPDNPDIYYNIGNLYYKQNKLSEAEEEFRQAIKLAPRYVQAHNNLGLVYVKQNNLKRAFEEFITSIEISPNHLEAHYNLGNLYFYENKLEDAAGEYKKVLSLDPGYISAVNNLGSVYLREGNYHEAAVAYKKAIVLRPASAKFHNNLANAYAKLGRFDEAISEFKRAIALDSRYVQAYNDLGSLYFEQNNLAQALVEYKKTLSLNPEYAEAYYNIGVIYFKLGRVDESKDNLIAAAGLFRKQNNIAQLEETEKLLNQIQ